MADAEEVLIRAQAGDPEAFRELYLAHHAALYRWALGELGNPEDARDVVQEAFVRAWGALAGFRGESSFLHWLFRIARNLIIDRARWRRRHPQVSLDEPLGPDSEETRGDGIAARGPGPAEAAEHDERLSRFRRALASLPEAQRAVLLLREQEGLAYEAIAVRHGLNVGTVRSRLARARGALAGLMRDGEEPS
ncbi:MAG: sigma-70 family RNA polymerase sigma factor [Candidatus Coatesbacteria bacterium]